VVLVLVLYKYSSTVLDTVQVLSTPYVRSRTNTVQYSTVLYNTNFLYDTCRMFVPFFRKNSKRHVVTQLTVHTLYCTTCTRVEIIGIVADSHKRSEDFWECRVHSILVQLLTQKRHFDNDIVVHHDILKLP
jgi:hypothetical protein